MPLQSSSSRVNDAMSTHCENGHAPNGGVSVGAAASCKAKVVRLHAGNQDGARWLVNSIDDGAAGASDEARRRIVQDPVVQRLCHALEAAEDGESRQLYAEPVRLAIVARLLGPPPERETNPQTRRTKAALQKWRLKRVLEFVNGHLEEKITLTALARVAGLSRMYFAAQFRAATGLRPHEFVLQRRIERSQELLVQTRLTLVDIALSVGFQTQAHFTTVFKRFAGDTPHQWRCANGDGG